MFYEFLEVPNSILDFGSTTLDAQFATINMGQGAASANTATATGVLTFGAGTLTATTVNLGMGATSSNAVAFGSGTINQSGGTAIISTMTIGKNTGTGATTTSGTYNLVGGILKATTIQAGTVAGSGAATRTINWTGGTIQNLSGGDLTIGTGIDIKMNGTNTFYADASRTITVNTALGFTGGITGTLVKDGAGTLTLTGTNSYTGNTNVNQGTLVIKGSISTSLLTTVQSGAALGGSGTVGAATVGGILAPGNSIGTLTATGDVTWNNNDAWVFELGVASLNLAAASGGSDNDLLNITGAGSDFLKGTGSSFTFDFANTGAVGWYKLVDWTGTTNFVGTDFSTTGLTSGLTGTFTVDSGTSALYLNIVPEPSAALLGTLGLLGLLRRRR